MILVLGQVGRGGREREVPGADQGQRRDRRDQGADAAHHEDLVQPADEHGPGNLREGAASRDGRASYAELAHATHWHESTVRRRVSELRAAGVLYLDVDVEEAAFGIGTRAHLWMSVAPARLAAVGEALARHPEIPFVAATSGASNLIASVLCRDDEALYRYLTERIASLDGVNAVEVAPIIRTAKRAATVLPAA